MCAPDSRREAAEDYLTPLNRARWEWENLREQAPEGDRGDYFTRLSAAEYRYAAELRRFRLWVATYRD